MKKIDVRSYLRPGCDEGADEQESRNGKRPKHDPTYSSLLGCRWAGRSFSIPTEILTANLTSK